MAVELNVQNALDIIFFMNFQSSFPNYTWKPFDVHLNTSSLYFCIA